MILGAADDAAVAALLDRVRSVAVLGVSDRFTRPSFRLAAYLLDRTDWEVTLVNPHVVETLGRLTHPSLALLGSAPDLVVAFRAAAAWAEVVDEVVEVGAGALWLCAGRDEAGGDAPDRGVPADATVLDERGLTVVTGRDLKADHGRWCA